MGQENIMKLPKLIKKFKPVLAHQLEMILLWYYSKTAKYRRPSKTTGKILLARTDGLGDFIIWLSCAKAFRQLYPEKKIVLMLALLNLQNILQSQCLNISMKFLILISIITHGFLNSNG